MRLPGDLEVRVYKALLEGRSIRSINTHEIVESARRENKSKESERVQIIRILKRLVKENFAARKVHGHANVKYHLTSEGRTFAQSQLNWWDITQPKEGRSLFCSTISTPAGHGSVAVSLNTPASQKAEIVKKAKEFLDILPEKSYLILRKASG